MLYTLYSIHDCYKPKYHKLMIVKRVNKDGNLVFSTEMCPKNTHIVWNIVGHSQHSTYTSIEYYWYWWDDINVVGIERALLRPFQYNCDSIFVKLL